MLYVPECGIPEQMTLGVSQVNCAIPEETTLGVSQVNGSVSSFCIFSPVKLISTGCGGGN
jgi:hypothetical protein